MTSPSPAPKEAGRSATWWPAARRRPAMTSPSRSPAARADTRDAGALKGLSWAAPAFAGRKTGFTGSKPNPGLLSTPRSGSLPRLQPNSAPARPEQPGLWCEMSSSPSLPPRPPSGPTDTLGDPLAEGPCCSHPPPHLALGLPGFQERLLQAQRREHPQPDSMGGRGPGGMAGTMAMCRTQQELGGLSA